MDRQEYWIECIAEALCEAGIAATKEQIEIVAEFVEGGHENIGQAFQAPCEPHYHETEVSKLKELLSLEKNKVNCDECQGKGRIREAVGNCHTSDSDCYKCKGAGRL